MPPSQSGPGPPLPPSAATGIATQTRGRAACRARDLRTPVGREGPAFPRRWTRQRKVPTRRQGVHTGSHGLVITVNAWLRPGYQARHLLETRAARGSVAGCVPPESRCGNEAPAGATNVIPVTAGWPSSPPASCPIAVGMLITVLLARPSGLIGAVGQPPILMEPHGPPLWGRASRRASGRSAATDPLRQATAPLSDPWFPARARIQAGGSGSSGETIPWRRRGLRVRPG